MEQDFKIYDELLETPTFTISNKTVKNQAIATLPDVLYTDTVNCLQSGVFSKKVIQKSTRFGPFDAPLTTYSTASKSKFLLKANQYDEAEDLYYDTSNERHCNWMCLVRPAINHDEQNLSAHIVKDKIYFTSIKTIAVKEELKVWYSPTYAPIVGKDILSQSKNASVLESNTSFPTTVQSNSQSDDYLDDVFRKSVPPKKRGWKRVNSTKKPDIMEMTISTLHNDITAQNVILKCSDNESLRSKRINAKTTLNNCSAKEFTCPTCGRVFFKKYTYKVHLLVHSDRRDFLCQTCGKSFKRKDKLGAHIKTHGQSHKPKKQAIQFVPQFPPNEVDKFVFKCEICLVGFRRRGMLINHLSRKHPNINVDSIPVLAQPIVKTCHNYVCPYCQKSYKSSTKRKIHIQRHHPGCTLPLHIREAKRYKSLENKAMIQPGNTIKSEPNFCPYCPCQYSTKSKMLKHIFSKHPKHSTDHVSSKAKTKDLPKCHDFIDTGSSIEKLLAPNLMQEETCKTLEGSLPSVDTLTNISDIAEIVGLPSQNYDQHLNLVQFSAGENLPFFQSIEAINNNDTMHIRRPSQSYASRKQIILQSMSQDPIQQIATCKSITNDINSTMISNPNYNQSLTSNDMSKVTVEQLEMW